MANRGNIPFARNTHARTRVSHSSYNACLRYRSFLNIVNVAVRCLRLRWFRYDGSVSKMDSQGAACDASAAIMSDQRRSAFSQV